MADREFNVKCLLSLITKQVIGKYIMCFQRTLQVTTAAVAVAAVATLNIQCRRRLCPLVIIITELDNRAVTASPAMEAKILVKIGNKAQVRLF